MYSSYYTCTIALYISLPYGRWPVITHTDPLCPPPSCRSCRQAHLHQACRTHRRRQKRHRPTCRRPRRRPSFRHRRPMRPARHRPRPTPPRRRRRRRRRRRPPILACHRGLRGRISRSSLRGRRGRPGHPPGGGGVLRLRMWRWSRRWRRCRRLRRPRPTRRPIARPAAAGGPAGGAFASSCSCLEARAALASVRSDEDIYNL